MTNSLKVFSVIFCAAIAVALAASITGDRQYAIDRDWQYAVDKSAATDCESYYMRWGDRLFMLHCPDGRKSDLRVLAGKTITLHVEDKLP